MFHSTRNTGWQPMRLLALYAPAGAEKALQGLPDFREEPAGTIPGWGRTWTATAVHDLVRELEGALPNGSVATADLDAYAADTYWTALATQADGTPLGMPDVVVRPADEADVATTLEVANQLARPGRPLGRRVGQPGRRRSGAGRDRCSTSRGSTASSRSTRSRSRVTAQAGVNGRRLEPS